MRSRFADHFNHDDQAAGYDADVRNQADPIRTGYDALLAWVAARALPDGNADACVLDLGASTGNLGLRLPAVRELVCVDVSAEMRRIGAEKLAGRPGVRWVAADLLEFFDGPAGPFDAVVSTYAIHHLTEDEKGWLFERIHAALAPGGRAVFGDLMFADAAERARVLAAYRASGRADLADEIEEEFFWDVTAALGRLEALGLEVATQRFSELSWGVEVRKPGPGWGSEATLPARRRRDAT